MRNALNVNQAAAGGQDSILEHSAKIGALIAALLPSSFNMGKVDAQEIRAAVVSPAEIAKAHAVSVSSVGQVVSRWNPDCNLYVQGDIGVNQRSLNELAGWLKSEHPNWTVYLAAQCANEVMTDREGRTHKGTEAVEFCLGQELFNVTPFGSLKDSRTGESNAAIMYITFDSEASYRKVGYFASEAYDNRGIGEAAWNRGLDKLAITKLREGRQVLLAVQTPIAEIDAKLAAKVSDEKQHQQEELASAELLLTRMSSNLEAIENQIADFNALHPDIRGDLSRPDLGPLMSTIDSVKGLIKLGKFSEIADSEQSFQTAADIIVRSLQDYDDAPNSIESSRNQANRLAEGSYGTAIADSVQLVEQNLQHATREHSKGNSVYKSYIEKAEEGIEKVKQKIEAIEIQEGSYKLFSGILHGVLAYGIGAMTYLAYRRRSESQSEAKSLIQEWTTAIDEKIDRLFTLDETKSLLFGKDASNARFTGETQALAEEIIQDIGNLFVLGSSAREVLSRATALVEPRETWGKVINLFTSGNFREAKTLLSTTPIVFDPESRIELILNGPKDGKIGLVGEISDYQPVTILFDDLISGFNKRALSALDKMEAIQADQLSLPGKMDGLRTSLEQLKKGTLPSVLSADSHLERTVSQYQIELEVISEQVAVDPVGAARQVSQLRNRVMCAEAVVALLESIQEQWGLPQIEHVSGMLRKRNIETEWVHEQFINISNQLHSLLQRQGIDKEFRESAFAVKQRVDEISQTLDEITINLGKIEESEVELSQLAQSIDEARTMLSERSGVEPNLLFKEPLANVELLFGAVQMQGVAARKSLNEANTRACTQSLEQVSAVSESIRECLRKSLNSESTFAAFKLNILSQLSAWCEVLPTMNQYLNDMREQFGRGIFQQKLEWRTRPLAPDTIEFNGIEIEQTLARIETLLARADSQYGRGEFVATLEQRAAINGEVQKAHDRIEEISAHYKRVKEIQIANQETVLALMNRQELIKQSVIDPKTSPESKSLFKQERVAWKQSLKVALKESNPVRQMEGLNILSQSVSRVEASLLKDEHAFHAVRQGVESLSQNVDQFSSDLDVARLASTPSSIGINLLREERDKIIADLKRHTLCLKKPHQAWQELESEQKQIYLEIIDLRSRLKIEGEIVKQAIETLRSAEENLKKTISLLESLGKSLNRATGQKSYDAALEALAAGDYGRVDELSSEAIIQSKNLFEEIRSRIEARHQLNSQDTGSNDCSLSDSSSSKRSSNKSSYDNSIIISYGASISGNISGGNDGGISGFISGGYDGGGSSSGFSSSGW